jgi:outer membrane biosynthesis protein TonB
MASRAPHALRLVLFIGLALFAAYLLWHAEQTEERVVRVEQRQANTCLGGQPRACRKLLNRLLTHGTTRQKRQLKRALKQRERLIRPDVQLPSKDAPEPAATPTPEPESPTPPAEPSPEPPVQTTTEPPKPEPLPEQDPALPPTPTVPVPPEVCQQLPDALPVCP